MDEENKRREAEENYHFSLGLLMNEYMGEAEESSLLGIDLTVYRELKEKADNDIEKLVKMVNEWKERHG